MAALRRFLGLRPKWDYGGPMQAVDRLDLPLEEQGWNPYAFDDEDRNPDDGDLVGAGR